MHESTLLKIILWGLGICTTGFLFLAGWIWWLVGEIHKRVTYQWLEEKFEKTLNDRWKKLEITLDSIKDALLGTFSKRGLITAIDETEHKVEEIEKRCKKLHQEKINA